MKKWWLHTIACVGNAVAATAILVLFFYDIFSTPFDFHSGDILLLLVILAGYGIYIISDIWGITLYYRHKNIGEISFTDKGKTQVLIVFLMLIQSFSGYISFAVIRRLMIYFPSLYEFGDLMDIIGTLFVVTFLTSVIVIIGYILLFRAIKKNKNIISKEIDSIGSDSFTEK